MRLRLFAYLLGAVGISALLVLFVGRSGGGSDAVIVRLPGEPGIRFAGFFHAQAQGDYETGNLDVAFVNEAFSPIDDVISGRASFGVASGIELLLARARGVPVIGVAVVHRKSPVEFLVARPADTAVWYRADSIRFDGFWSAQDSLTFQVMRYVARSRDEVSQSRTRPGPETFSLRPRSGFSDSSVPDTAVDPRVVAPVDYEIPLIGDVLFTTDSIVEANPELVRAFVTATVAGWNSALTDPAAAVRSLMQFSSIDDFAAEVTSMQQSVRYIKPDAVPFGMVDRTRWTELRQLLRNAGLMTQSIHVATVFTPQFLPQTTVRIRR